MFQNMTSNDDLTGAGLILKRSINRWRIPGLYLIHQEKPLWFLLNRRQKDERT